MEPPLWYVAYGSNMSPAGLARYVGGGSAAEAHSTWIQLEHPTYFAGRSVRWDGAVTFLGLRRRPGTSTPARAYAVDETQFWRIFDGENGARAVEHSASSLRDLALAVGQWHAFDVGPRAHDDPLWKYNAVLRLPDVENRPAYTCTTARDLEVGEPHDAYLQVIREALDSRDPHHRS